MEFGTDKLLFGLTGGMGSGKSTVSSGLAERGAVIVDADQIVHDLQEPGMPALNAMVELLGDDILLADGRLNRPRTGEIVFANPAKRKALNALLSPLIRDEMGNQIRVARSDDIVVLDVPLLIEAGMTDLHGILVVNTPVELAIHRLQKYRGFSEDEARSRIASQLSIEERLKHANYVIKNHGNRQDLECEIDQAWIWLKHAHYIGGLAVKNTQD